MTGGLSSIFDWFSVLHDRWSVFYMKVCLARNCLLHVLLHYATRYDLILSGLELFSLPPTLIMSEKP